MRSKATTIAGFPLPTTVSAIALSLFLAACGGSGGGSTNTDTDNSGSQSSDNNDTGDNNGDDGGQNTTQGSVNPTFANIAVHDPSVIKVENEYYVIGSHLSAAKTSDLMNWERVADGVSPANPLFDDVTVELADALGWADTNTLWAGDIRQLSDGRFYMYYNACRGDAPQSAMGIAVADDIEGPYENVEIFLRSGWEADSALEAGAVTEGYIADDYDPRVHPNVIDPHTFYDHEGNLWMTYGSYSGGLYILQMNPDTGLPLPDQGYGKHLIGGNHSRIEAPYVLYSPESEYYYLFSSFGGLDASGAYNIRVARSVSPDGPYLDYEGNDVAEVKSNPSLPLFDDASIADGAVKLMGNFRFANGGDGYVSPGHNSAYYDEEMDKHLLFFHTRFPGRGEQHEVRVHEMFVNADGWLVVAPHRYVPTSESEETVESTITEADLPGTYELVNHGQDITAEIKNSITVELEEGGQISGDASGDWTLGADHKITITLDEEGSFEGVAARLWSPAAKEFVVTFSALSVEGVAIWGSRSLD